LLDTHSVSINWGDGNTTVGAVVQGSGSGSVSGSHIYATGGIFTITVTLTDDDGGTSQLTSLAAIGGVGLNNGQLQIIGTEGRDVVHIKIDGSDGDSDRTLKVMANLDVGGGNAQFDFNLSDVTSILIIGCGGNDHLHVDKKVMIPASIDGGAGDDQIWGGGGNDTITDMIGNNDIKSGAGSDIITVGNGHNKIDAGSGNNSVTAGNGNNKIKADGGSDGGADGNNVIVVGNGDNDIDTGDGNDTITSGSGKDKIRSGDGNNTIFAGDGDNDIDSGKGNDLIVAGSGNDKIKTGDGDNIVYAGAGNDTIDGGDGADLLIGGDGNDVMKGGKGRDILVGGIGADNLVGDQDDDILIAGYTLWDTYSEPNRLALTSILKEWISSNNYTTRVANITNGTGLTSGFRLVGDAGLGQTVFNDNDVDKLTGSQGTDWFFGNRINDNGGVLDNITDQAISELWNDTDF
jgi:Ca2+-binding RTX toxin-like protein